MSEEPKPVLGRYCAARVVTGPSAIRGLPHMGPCRNAPKHVEDGASWCAVHAPSKVRARDEQRRVDEARRHEAERRHAAAREVARIIDALRRATDADLLAEVARRGLALESAPVRAVDEHEAVAGGGEGA